MNQPTQNIPRKPTLQMPFMKRGDDDEYRHSYITMLNIIRRVYELGGDPQIKDIIDKAERALGK